MIKPLTQTMRDVMAALVENTTEEIKAGHLVTPISTFDLIADIPAWKYSEPRARAKTMEGLVRRGLVERSTVYLDMFGAALPRGVHTYRLIKRDRDRIRRLVKASQAAARKAMPTSWERILQVEL